MDHKGIKQATLQRMKEKLSDFFIKSDFHIFSQLVEKVFSISKPVSKSLYPFFHQNKNTLFYISK